MRKNEKGSSLIFALAVIMIITMVIAACMAISYSYYNRSIVANSERQAYLTAKSVLTNIVDNIVAKDVDYLGLIPEQGKGEVSYNVDDNFPSNEMGTVDSITIIRNLDEKDENDKFLEKLTVSVIVTYGKSNKQINADLKQYDGDDDNWQLSKYYESEVDNKEKNNIIRAEDLINFIQPIHGYMKKNDLVGLTDYINTYTDITGVTTNTSNVKDNTTVLRPFVYKVLQNGSAPQLNNEELNLPDKMKDKIYYLHVMFGYKASNVPPRFIIYASTEPDGIKNDWTPELVYLPDTGHWYFSRNQWGNNNFPSMADLNSSAIDEATGKVRAQLRYEQIISLCIETNIAQ